MPPPLYRFDMTVFFSFSEFLKNITQETDKQSAKFPTEEDLEGAAVALMRLQDTYKLSTVRMADGIIQGIRAAEPLTGMCCD